jgi:hypothetical protein
MRAGLRSENRGDGVVAAPRSGLSTRLWERGDAVRHAALRSGCVARAHGSSVPRPGAGNQMAVEDRSGLAEASAAASTPAASAAGEAAAGAA